MEDLSKDLSTALEEASEFHINRVWKCKSRPLSVGPLSSSIPKSSAKSEDSESSLENWKRSHFNFSKNGPHQHTDSDEIIYKNSIRHHTTSWRNCTANMGESDSLNENCHLSREPRRKRKFKRMIVDPPTVPEGSYPNYMNCPMFIQKNKRLRNLKSQKVSKVALSVKPPKVTKVTVSQLSAEMKNFCKEFGNASTSCGKRKRCTHERNSECVGCECKTIFSTIWKAHDKASFSNTCQHMDYNGKITFHEHTSSGLSSSESDYGLLNDEESREADDEHSDYYHESGPTYGVPHLPQLQPNISSHPGFAKFSERLQEFKDTAEKIFSTCDGRQIRSGRRRLEKQIAVDSIKQDENVPLDSYAMSVDSCISNPIPNDTKKRKGMNLTFTKG